MPERLNLVVFRCVTRISGLAFRSGLGIHWNVTPSMIKFGTRIYIYICFFFPEEVEKDISKVDPRNFVFLDHILGENCLLTRREDLLIVRFFNYSDAFGFGPGPICVEK